MLVDRLFAERVARDFLESEMGRKCSDGFVGSLVAVQAYEQADRYPEAEFDEETDDESALKDERDEAKADFDAALRVFLKERLKEELG